MKLVVNDAEVEVDDRQAKTPLLWVLRDVLGLHGTKFGCGAGFCAACTVLMDGRNTKSCQIATDRPRRGRRHRHPDFDAHPVMRMRSVPQMEVHVIGSTEPPSGVGEVSVPSVAPALANAIAALTGTRIRNLRFSKTIKIY